MDSKNNYVIASVQKSLKVLKLFDAQHKEMTLTELSLRADMSKGTMLRVLKTLQEEDFIRYDMRAKRYQLGVAIHALAVDSFFFNPVAEVIRDLLMAPVKELNMVAHIAVLQESQVMLIDRILPNSSYSVYDLNSTVGGTIEPHCTGVGKVLSAFAPPKIRKQMLDACTFERKSHRTITDRDQYEAVLEVVRQQGYAVNYGENEEYLKCITYPVFDSKNNAFAAVSLTGVIQRWTDDLDEKCHQLLQFATEQASREYGYRVL